MVWYGMVWYGMVWYGMIWYGMVWYGMVWYGMVWYDIILSMDCKGRENLLFQTICRIQSDIYPVL